VIGKLIRLVGLIFVVRQFLKRRSDRKAAIATARDHSL
jgi:hypothetical protein